MHLSARLPCAPGPAIKGECVPRLRFRKSRASIVRRAKRLLAKKIGEERMRNILFLMDFEGAADAGDIEDANPEVEPAE